MTQRLAIKEIHRNHPISIVGPTDFETERRGSIDPDQVLQDPKFSLYCFDPDNDAAIFVEVNDPIAVESSPFYYQGQLEHVVGLVSMPLPEFHRIAEQIPEPPGGVILVHSVGRCGSTLASKLFSAVPSVHSLSEPDDLTQMIKLRRLGDEWLRPVLRSSIKWRAKPRAGAPAAQLAVKMRSEVLALAELFGSCFPRAKHLFLYRDGVAWMATIFRGVPLDRDVYDPEANRKMEESWSNTLPLIQEYRREEAPMNPIQIRILGWITSMEGYLLLQEMGVPSCAVRFEDLTNDPLPIVERMFEFCETTDVDWEAIEGVLGRDSQAGTIYDRDERRKFSRELTDELVRDIHDIVASRPRLREPGVVVPGTVCLPSTTIGP